MKNIDDEAAGGAAPELDLPRLPRRFLGGFGPHINWSARRVELMAVVLSLMVAAFLVPQVLHFSHRDEGVRRVWAWLPFWQTLESAEYRLYDARFAARGVVVPRSRDKIAIVAIDQASLEVFKQHPWPLPRRFHAQLIRRLKQAGARVIALDLDFSSAAANRGDDAALAGAMQSAGNVILPSYIAPELKRGPTREETNVAFTNTPPELLDELTPDLALAYLKTDSDGAARGYPLRGVINDENIGSFAALAAAMSQNMLDGGDNKRYAQALATNTWPDARGLGHRVPLVQSQLGREDAPRLFTTPLYFWGPPGTFATYSYSDVQDQYSPAQLKEKFNGRIVFVGATAHILKDVFPLPRFTAANPDAIVESVIPGVELHATATAMLLDGVYIHTVSTAATLLALFALTLAASLWTAIVHGWVSARARTAQHRWAKWNLPGRIYSPVWFGLYAILASLPALLFWQTSVWLFVQRQLWVIVLYPLLGAALGSGLVLLLLFGVESGERRKTVAHFARHVSPDVLEEILAHPEENHARPRRVVATVLFTDLEGFTSYSETHEPEEVVAAVNAYMNRMVPIIARYGGNIDKYIGDAIMAFFGAPAPYWDHAARALMCAVELQEECRRFREETGIPFYTRIGIHTGEVIVGYMGSDNRSDFTVIGDTVNLASRLESQNKRFGSWIMCSASTFEAAPGVVSVESASARIAGKSQSVDVFMVRGLSDSPQSHQGWGHGLPAAEVGVLDDGLHHKLDDSDLEPLPAPLPALPESASHSTASSATASSAIVRHG